MLAWVDFHLNGVASPLTMDELTTLPLADLLGIAFCAPRS
jgi:hypothetical protein